MTSQAIAKKRAAGDRRRQAFEALLDKNGMNVASVAKAADLKANSLYNFKNGHSHSLRSDTLQKVMAVLSIHTPEDLQALGCYIPVSPKLPKVESLRDAGAQDWVVRERRFRRQIDDLHRLVGKQAAKIEVLQRGSRFQLGGPDGSRP